MDLKHEPERVLGGLGWPCPCFLTWKCVRRYGGIWSVFRLYIC